MCGVVLLRYNVYAVAVAVVGMVCVCLCVPLLFFSFHLYFCTLGSAYFFNGSNLCRKWFSRTALPLRTSMLYTALTGGMMAAVLKPLL